MVQPGVQQNPAFEVCVFRTLVSIPSAMDRCWILIPETTNYLLDLVQNGHVKLTAIP